MNKEKPLTNFISLLAFEFGFDFLVEPKPYTPQPQVLKYQSYFD
jgi:hypothetical protein